jgi:hypothetical protein
MRRACPGTPRLLPAAPARELGSVAAHRGYSAVFARWRGGAVACFTVFLTSSSDMRAQRESEPADENTTGPPVSAGRPV